MKYLELFKLESFLSEFKADKIHVELKQETAFPYAFGESSSVLMNVAMFKGLYIMVIPSNEREANDIFLGLKKRMNEYDFEHSITLDYSKSFKLRMIIEVTETH